MSPTPHPPHPLRRCARLRGGAIPWFLALLIIAVLAVGAPLEAPVTVSATTTATEAAAAEHHDVLDTGLRLPEHHARRAAPSPPCRTAPSHRPARPAPHPQAAPPAHAPASHPLRSVVLRC